MMREHYDLTMTEALGNELGDAERFEARIPECQPSLALIVEVAHTSPAHHMHRRWRHITAALWRKPSPGLWCG